MSYICARWVARAAVALSVLAVVFVLPHWLDA
jgi:hypothetical protein